MRTYTVNDVIQLPRLDASAALALGKQLVTAAKAVPQLPKALSKAHDGVAAAFDILRRANAARFPVLQGGGSKRASDVDRKVDSVVSGIFDWLRGWSKLPHGSEAGVAKSLLVELFPTGIKFIQFPYKLEWAEIEARLVRIEVGGLDAKFRQLGGASFLSQLRKAHKEYGEVLGITGVLSAEEPPAKVREALDTFLLALRNYVLKVAAYVEPEEPETEELAAMLLAPLHEWRLGTARSARERTVEEPAPEPAPTETSEPETP